ncbi:hypothetical protein MSG28_014345 [Choristoneura fumiferana]|uniref:Uncharacterized protein n=1 Tax=Choristoneura fumiferana TaxID=7141 RepID=A0ACC0JH10_CHOFU|nr:hypothetical protein MSG28_014345 [Choristoneura fumiferana]
MKLRRILNALLPNDNIKEQDESDIKHNNRDSEKEKEELDDGKRIAETFECKVMMQNDSSEAPVLEVNLGAKIKRGR